MPSPAPPSPSSSCDYRPRFSGEITQDQYNILQQILPHGMKKHLIQIFVNGIISIHSKGGQVALGAIISEVISIDQILTLGLSTTREDKIKVLEKKLEELRNGHS